MNSLAFVFKNYGNPLNVLKYFFLTLRLVNLKLRNLNDNEVLVKFRASPINPADINTIQGVYPATPYTEDGLMFAGNEGF